jgi:hypothetical protein
MLRASNGGISMNGEMESMWKIMTVAYFKELSGKNTRSSKDEINYRFRTLCDV